MRGFLMDSHLAREFAPVPLFQCETEQGEVNAGVGQGPSSREQVCSFEGGPRIVALSGGP